MNSMGRAIVTAEGTGFIASRIFDTLLSLFAVFLILVSFVSSSHASTLISGSITTNTVWTKEASPYIIGEAVVVEQDAVLTIEPGVIIKFDPNTFGAIVYGSIVARGTKAEPVVFTSLLDDTVGGDTNEDGEESTPYPDDWLLAFSGTTSTPSVFENVVFRYADTLSFKNSSASFTHAVISYAHDGLFADNSSELTLNDVSFYALLKGAIFSRNHSSIIASRIDVDMNESDYDAIALFNASHARIVDSVVRHTGRYGGAISLFSSTADIEGSLFENGKDAAVQLYNDWSSVPALSRPSSIMIDHSLIRDFDEEGLLLFDDATAKITDTTIERTGEAAIGIYDSTANLTRTTLKNGMGVGIELYDSWSLPRTSSLTMTDSTIENFLDYGINPYDSAVSIERSRITNNGTGIEIYTGRRPANEEPFTIAHSSITGNMLGAAVYGNRQRNGTILVTPLDARNNWWGDASGPFDYETNPEGLGDEIMYDVLFDPWLTSDPFATPPPCTQNCNSNVLFLPGIEASRLYRPDYAGGTDRLWEPTSDSDARDLFMDATGASVRNDIYTKDIIDEAYGTLNIYKSFLTDLNTWKNTDNIIADYSAVPYDWRLTLDEVLDYGNQMPDGRIYYSGDLRATSSPYILQELRRLVANSRTGKVTIIAHSNGGLVAKALLKRLQDTHDPILDKIDTVIMVAVPQTGTPHAIGALLHGYEQGIPFDPIHPLLSPQVAREFAYNDPMAHHLLPSAAYFNGEGSTVRTPLATFNSGTTTQIFINAYGHAIENGTELHDFLLGREGRPLPTTSDLANPTVLRPGLLSYGEGVHQALDAWIPPASTTIHEIAGWGLDTVAGITYDTDRKCVERTLFVCTQYADTLRYTPDLVVDGDGVVVVPSALAMSTSSPNVMRWWVNLGDYNDPIIGVNRKHKDILEVSELRTFIKENLLTKLTTTLPLFITTSTPVPTAINAKRLRFFLHSPLALSATDVYGNEISNATSTIAGAQYAQFGDVQYISVPSSVSPMLHLNGYADGSFTLDVLQSNGDTTTATTTFLGIPNATSTRASMSFIDGTIAHASALMVDIDGNGTNDLSLQPKIGSIVLPDITPPEIQITFSTSTKALVISGTDDMGTTTISATTTYPTLKKKQKEPQGIATTTVTARDEGGNTTTLVYTEKLPSPKQRDTLTLTEIAYNGATTTIASTTLSYKWRIIQNGTYKLFASHLRTIATSTESHYRPKKNITILMQKPTDLDDSDTDDDADTKPVKIKLPGMIVPSLITKNGSFIINY